jgi:hypothetical protein
MDGNNTNEFGFYDTLFEDDGKIQIITRYDIFKEEIQTDYEGFWKSLLAKIDKFIHQVKCKFGKVIGAIDVSMSCIMTKEITECMFLNDSLEILNQKLYELYYEVARLKNIRGTEVVDVSKTAMNIILRDIDPAMSDITFKSIMEMMDDEEVKDLEKNGDENDSSGEKDGSEGIGMSDSESKQSD